MSEPLRLLLAGYVAGFASALALVVVLLVGLRGSPPPPPPGGDSWL